MDWIFIAVVQASVIFVFSTLLTWFSSLPTLTERPSAGCPDECLLKFWRSSAWRVTVPPGWRSSGRLDALVSFWFIVWLVKDYGLLFGPISCQRREGFASWWSWFRQGTLYCLWTSYSPPSLCLISASPTQFSSHRSLSSQSHLAQSICHFSTPPNPASPASTSQQDCLI